ncbi:major facilitator superfamily domain-containing protein [Plectosphaerella plurivora]|uniref:Major facilitator superfamily domain-containing protein n=1 Tax=Plectosphaerella plurivora TaxID=936078 RepID=A0A9P8V6S6_9PEZI|nr:major facilitator superfamily domain-containing protein [Plectosphaerella plurivora]
MSSRLEKQDSQQVEVDHRDLDKQGDASLNATNFDSDAEKRLRRKTDLYIVPMVALLYLFCFIDRANIGNARLANLEKDLGMGGYDYNLILSVFYISYAAFEIPATLLCKYIGPGWFIPITTILFGICTIGTAFVQTRGQMIAVRFLLGIFESGMMPGVAYYLSRWYRRAELSLRIGYYICMTPLAGAFGGLLASAILSLDSVGSLKQWRMIFVIEGIVTAGLGLLALAILTDNPSTARWLSEEEKQLALDRVKSERLGQTSVLDKMNSTKLKNGFLNPITLSTAVVFFFGNVVVLGISFFLPTIIRSIYPGVTVVQMQLRTVPPYILAAGCLLGASYLSRRLDTRQVFLALSGPLVVIGYGILIGMTSPEARYAAIFLTASSIFIGGALSNAQVSANTVSDTARSMAIGTNSMAGYLGGLLATWTYLPWDGPMYPIGNGLNLAAAASITIVATVFLFWMKWDNRRRDMVSQEEQDAMLEGLSPEQIRDLEWKHPDWRWKL